MAPEICVESLFVCRGKERLQVLVGSPVSHQFPLRKTTSTHRQTGEIHSADIEDWHNMTRSRRIRAHVPRKLMLTAFGTKQEPSAVEPPWCLPWRRLTTGMSGQSEKFNVSQKTSCEVPEGWAPPPVPLHGPLFRNLTPQEKQGLMKLHKNLGHPGHQNWPSI